MFSILGNILHYGLSVNTSFGWESLKPVGRQEDDGLAGYLTLTRAF